MSELFAQTIKKSFLVWVTCAFSDEAGEYRRVQEGRGKKRKKVSATGAVPSAAMIQLSVSSCNSRPEQLWKHRKDQEEERQSQNLLANEKHIEALLEKYKGLMYLSPVFLKALPLFFFFAENSAHKVSASFAVNVGFLPDHAAAAAAAVSPSQSVVSNPSLNLTTAVGMAGCQPGRGIGGSSPQGERGFYALPCPAFYPCGRTGHQGLIAGDWGLLVIFVRFDNLIFSFSYIFGLLVDCLSSCLYN